MKTSTLSIALAAALATGSTFAQTDNAFKKLDKDSDGFLSRGEVSQFEGMPRAFSEADEFIKFQSIQARASAGKYVDDSMVTAKVKTALAKELKLDSASVSVETHRGKVILSGFVDTDGQRQKAAGVAKGIEGVTEVKNALEVK